MSQVFPPTLDTTYTLQTQTPSGSWYWEGTGECTTEEEIHEVGRTIFGGVTYRVVTIVRHVGEAVNPR